MRDGAIRRGTVRKKSPRDIEFLIGATGRRSAANIPPPFLVARWRVSPDGWIPSRRETPTASDAMPPGHPRRFDITEIAAPIRAISLYQGVACGRLSIRGRRFHNPRVSPCGMPEAARAAVCLPMV